MYAYDVVDGTLTLSANGEAVLVGVAPRITLDDGEEVALEMASGSAEPNAGDLRPDDARTLVYRDPAEGLELRLVLEASAGALVVSANVRVLGQPSIGVRAKGLAPFGGLTLAVNGLGTVYGLMANYLHKDWWTRPHFDTDLTTLPPRTQSIVWRTEHITHQLLCVCNDVLKTEIAGAEDGLRIQVSAYAAGYIDTGGVLVVLASDDDPFVLPERTVGAGMAAMGKVRQMRDDKRYPTQLDYLGWCSWDAFYRAVSAEGVLEKAAEFDALGVPVRWFIIDDGWLSERERRLMALEPDPEKFPDGFGPVIAELKRRYGVHWVGVWHTLFGYWGGIDPESELIQSMGDALTTMRNGMVVPSAEPSQAYLFWDRWHSEMRQAGVDFVKVDCQSGLAAFWRHETAVGAAAAGVHDSLEASVGKAFDNAMVNCMGMAIENLWHRPTSAVTRNSDDFFPKREESFIEHALQNAYNAFYHAPFMWLDWDMWWTEHTHAGTHAILRAVSGGPVYVSDRVGETNAAQLWPLILSDGRLLRCDLPGMATADCLFVDPSKHRVPLKIWNRVGDAAVVAAVNVHAAGGRVEGTVSPKDVPGLGGGRFVVYEFFSRRAVTMAWDASLSLSLADKASALYLILPLGGSVTPIGLAEKYIAPATVADWTTSDERTIVVLFEGGLFTWAAEVPPAEVRINGEVAQVVTGDGVFFVDCSDRQGTVWVEIVH